ncbi:hypothetical protein ACJRO7_032069 [Eucalyptus globulus]|uniref:TIR domain-containing protein n=1 Tax=Eucalyptus globulus TaxID=34317 RepID=A0ABD3JLQ1_EUCGL
MVTWRRRRVQYFLDTKAFQTLFPDSHFDFLLDSDLKEKLRAKKDSFAAFVAPVVLSMIAYEQLHRKKACECEVFLSFSGKGALKNFADSLYKDMVDAGIGVFRNDYWLPRHEKIGLKAIKSSKISILILSQKYDSSRRCLDELVQVMKCTNDSSGHVVLPIFYRVKPADVRCEVDVCDPMVAEERKQVLKEISSLKGWESDEIAAGDEGQLVESVVRKVLVELKKALEPVITENSVGIKSPLEKIMKFLDSCGSTLYVGIHGEGGVGKTTLAKVIYNKLSQQFDHCSFIPNVAESWKCNGIEHGNEQPSTTISLSFRSKKVLILLDDVNTNDQLKELIGERNWFAPGSRIIITTREKSILDWAKVDYKHEHKAMEIDEAEILFARHAFRMDSLPDKFSKLSREVISTVRRLPLIVEVIGSYLCGKSKALWEETKEKLQESQRLRQLQELPRLLQESQELPRMEMQEILEILYNALKFEQKKIFLDIASFLVGSDVRTASCMWDTSDFYLELGIEELIFMSLIKIGDNHELRMHDEVRDFGRNIAREGRCKEADNGRRLWDSEEALKMLDEKEGAANIRGLSLDKGNSRQTVDYRSEQFKNLVSLRFLSVSDANFVGDFDIIFSKLRWLQWERFPEKLKVENFAVKELAVLDFSRSMISEKWIGWEFIKSAVKLKVLNLTGCSLESIFFLSEFKHIEILILRNCNKLKIIYPTIGLLETIVSLDLSGCSSLKELPPEVGNLKGLKELFLDQTNIQDIPNSMWSLVKMQRLSLQSCPRLRLNRDSVVKLESLAELELAKTKITELPESIKNLQNLGILNVSKTGIKMLPNAIGRLTKLRELDASGCRGLIEVTASICNLTSLQSLDLRDCVALPKLPELPSNLTVVSVTCKSAKLPSFSHLSHLKQLRLHNCKYLVSIPELPSTTLELEITGCEALEFLTPQEAVEDIKVSLKRLDIIRCNSLGKLDLSQLNLLSVLCALDCVKIQEIEGLDKLDSLESLTIHGKRSLTIHGSNSSELDKPFSSMSERAYFLTTMEC